MLEGIKSVLDAIDRHLPSPAKMDLEEFKKEWLG